MLINGLLRKRQPVDPRQGLKLSSRLRWQNASSVLAQDEQMASMEVVEMKPRHWSMLGAAAAMAALIGSAAIAQGPGPMTGESDRRMWGGGMGWGMWRGGPWERGPEAMLDRVEGRLAFIKAELKINEAQTPAWNTLAGAVRTAAKHHNDRMKALFTGETKPRTLPERLDAQERFLNVRIDDIRQIKGALKALYALLSEEQKSEADEIVLPMTGMGGPHWWGR